MGWLKPSPLEALTLLCITPNFPVLLLDLIVNIFCIALGYANQPSEVISCICIAYKTTVSGCFFSNYFFFPPPQKKKMKRGNFLS
jgi:hypothetical protein